jgi:hypothetical protein
MKIGLFLEAWRLKGQIGETKQWYLSKTIWVNLLTLLASVGVVGFGVDLGLKDEEINALAVAAVALANIWLRLRTAQPLQLGGGNNANTIASDADTSGHDLGNRNELQ